VAQHLDRSGGIFHWESVLRVLSWSPVLPFLVALGFDASDDDVVQRAATAVSRIEETLRPREQLGEMSPIEFRAASERALNGALDEFTPSQRRVFVQIGSRSQGDSARAFAWLIALRHVVRNAADMPRIVALKHVEEVRVLVAEGDAQHDAVEVAAQLDANEKNEDHLAALLRIVWFDRFWNGFVRWPASEREALIEYAAAQFPSQGVADRLREHHVPPPVSDHPEP
jgi:hypothetical protein